MSRVLEIRFNRNWLIALCILPITYNAILAVVNSNVASMSFFHAALVEILIVFLSMVYVFRNGVLNFHKDAIFLVFVAILSMVMIWLASGFFYIDFFRNILIISVFTLLGRELVIEDVVKVYKVSLIIVLIFLLLEIINIGLYVDIFGPAIYFENTRGVAVQEFNDVGVFGNAMGFEGRFGYGVFGGPRTSSIFLEQVSLANFTIITVIFLFFLNRYLGLFWRFTSILFVALSLLSTESRLAAILVSFFLLYSLLFSRTSFFIIVMVVPCVVFLGSVYAGFYPVYTGDNLPGRISLGFGHLNNMSFGDFFGFGIYLIDDLWDSGYAYLIASGTIFGFLGFWVYIFRQVLLINPIFINCLFFFVVYVSLALSIGGNAIFSMKVSAFAWLYLGFLTKYNLFDGSYNFKV